MWKRPLVGEPLAVDLLNTRWRAAGGLVDMLETVSGFEQWLAESGQGDVRPTEAARAAACEAREAIRHYVMAGRGAPDGGGRDDVPGEAAQSAASAESAINGVLARGLTVHRIDGGKVSVRTIMTGPEWTVAWRAAANYLELLAAAPDGIRRCSHPECVLHFFDPTGRRRWCSMAGCGNRVKAKRHYARRAAWADGPGAAAAD